MYIQIDSPILLTTLPVFIRYKYLVYLHVEELFCYPISLHSYLNHSFWVRYNGREI